jgi:hypothetical protein
VALLHHLERVEELLPEHVLASSVIALGGEHRDAVLGQLVGAEVRLAAPDRQQHIARHPGLLLDRGQRASVLGRELLRLPRHARDIRFLDVVGRRLHELGLAARRCTLAARQVEIGQRQIGFDPARRRVERVARNAERLGLRPQIGKPFLKAGIGGRRGRGGERHKTRTEKNCRISAKATHGLNPFDCGRTADGSAVAILCNDST